MSALFKVPGLNVYIQVMVTIVSIAVTLITTRNKERKESVLEVVNLHNRSFGLVLDHEWLVRSHHLC